MRTYLRPALVSMVLFTLILGLAYPLAMTGIAGLAFPRQAAGSLVSDAGGHVIGSSLIAQGFAKPEYLHPRPSAAGNGYDPMNSGGTNLGPLDKKLTDRVAGDAAHLRQAYGQVALPPDALTTSASGLDPDISPENARMQAPLIAQARGVPESEIAAVIAANTTGPFLGFVGQPTVSVLEVNRALDARFGVAHVRVP